MNSPSSNKKLLILMGIFLIVVSSFVIASFTSSENTFTFTGEPTENITGSFTLTNSYQNYTINNIDYNFIPNPLLTGSSLSSDSLIITNSSNQIVNGSGPINISYNFKIPQGLNAIDDKFVQVVWDVGLLNISGNATNYSTVTPNYFHVEQIVTLKVQIDNHLEFYNNEIEFESSGEDPKNTSSGKSRTVKDGDSVTMVVRYENTFTEESIIFYRKDIEFVLYVDGEELDRQGGRTNVPKGEVGEAELGFDVEDLDAGETYDVEIEMTGFTDYGSDEGGRHGEVFKFEIDVEEASASVPDIEIDSDNDGVTDDLDLCPGTNILCTVDEAGCEMDPDNDSICNGVDRTPNGEVREEQTTQNTISKQTESNKDEIEESIVVKKESGSGGTGSFFFGLIVGFIGAALFFTLTKI